MTANQGTEAMLRLMRGEQFIAGRQPDTVKNDPAGEPVALAPDELLHPEVPAVFLVRLGRLRISQFLPDGREVTRAVLQAGERFETLAGGATPDPEADLYALDDMVVMALSEAELWRLPAAGTTND